MKKKKLFHKIYKEIKILRVNRKGFFFDILKIIFAVKIRIENCQKMFKKDTFVKVSINYGKE